jgi:hypothetical protein
MAGELGSSFRDRLASSGKDRLASSGKAARQAIGFVFSVPDRAGLGWFFREPDSDLGPGRAGPSSRRDATPLISRKALNKSDFRLNLSIST